jgi:enoyl-CoA hydratase
MLAVMAEFVTLRIAESIATIRLDRPPVNAVNLQALRELAAAAERAAADPEVAAVVVYGGEKVFCGGDDVAELAELGPTQARLLAADRQAALGCLARIPRPTVAAISGYAVAGGLELALGADWRVVGDNVKLAMPQVRAGYLPAGGGVARLTALIGPSKAKDVIFGGRFVDAEEASRLGLVDRVVAPDDVYSAALSWARQFIGLPTGALAAAKAAAGDLESGPVAERQMLVDVFSSPERRAAVRAYAAHGPGWPHAQVGSA